MKQNPFCLMPLKKVVDSFSVYLVIMLVVFLTSFNAFAAWDTWEIGYQQFIAGIKSGVLKINVKQSGGPHSVFFATRVGGVAFETIAVPEEALLGKNIELHYDKSQRDGQRLSISIEKTRSSFLPNWLVPILPDWLVSIESETYHPFLPDWQLVPIARYADSEFDAVVSLFGEKANEQYFDIVYHPAFGDTLLGLRLLQMDVLLMDMRSFQSLPKLRGTVIKGEGEPKIRASPLKRRRAMQFIIDILKTESDDSWVFTDYEVKVEFLVLHGKFKLTGNPYYSFWKRNEKLLEDIKTLSIIYRKEHQLKEVMKKMQVIALDNLTESMKKQEGFIQAINPTVYDAAVQTMRFAAFFRYVKRNNKKSWYKFLQQLKSVEVEPVVKTPNRWKRPTFFWRRYYSIFEIF
jgi:hypothetical protein